VDAYPNNVFGLFSTGGVNKSNIVRVVHGAVAPSGRALDGVAVISAIVASQQPESAARELLSKFKSARRQLDSIPQRPRATNDLLRDLVEAVKQMRQGCGLIHHITNVGIWIDSLSYFRFSS
jgi:thiamine-phosphate diphosphorylase/hydroxyethylthiazole kinase